MADPFTVGLDALFHAPGSAAASYRDDDVDLPAIRIIASGPDRLSRFGDTMILPASHVIEVRRSDVAAPRIDGRIATARERFVVTLDPVSDLEGLSWACGAELSP